MSAIGKGSLSLRKKDVVQQKSIGVGFTKVVFAHKATGGESSINLNSLSTPSELSSQGFVQPSPGTLSDLNIYFYRRNLTLISSLRGVLMDFLSYNVASNSLLKLLGFTLEPGEIIIGIVDPAPKNDLLVVDGEAIAATGELAIGVTDFAVGTPFETNKYPTQQIGAVKVYRNGLLQARCEGNSLSNDGNYIEVPVSGGLGSLIRFKTAPVNQADNVIVTSNGAYFERPSSSMMANIEALGGQMDQVISVLSDVSGQPETYFQTAPNQVDLRQFGDTVINHESRIDTIEAQSQKWLTAGFANAQNINNNTVTEANLTGVSTSGFSTSGNAIILPANAFYCFAANTAWGGNVTGYREVKLQFSTNNGGSWSDFLIATVGGTSPSGGGAGGPQISGGRFFNAGVWIRGTVYQNSGGALSLVSDGSQNNINIWLGGRS
jgi:hypothetical protein